MQMPHSMPERPVWSAGFAGSIAPLAEALRDSQAETSTVLVETSKRCSRLWPRLEAALAAAGQAALLQSRMTDQLRLHARYWPAHSVVMSRESPSLCTWGCLSRAMAIALHCLLLASSAVRRRRGDSPVLCATHEFVLLNLINP